jgi:Fur family zinc uptake transcriptional regulator
MSAADPFPAALHDHERCVAAALAVADSVCGERGAKLTELRRRVLELIWTSHAPIGAYQLMELLGRERSRVAPPTVYRALDFLVAQGLVHRIECLNAFVGCRSAATAHRAFFLICRHCGEVGEFEDVEISTTLDRRLSEAGFVPDTERVEVVGTCARCRRAPS